MKLSTRCRYGTRILIDMALHYSQGPVQLGRIAGRQNISLKYVEQIMIPLKRAGYVQAFRGSRGGHMLAKSPEQITVGEVVAILEGGESFTECVENPDSCSRAPECPTQELWREAAKAMYDRLNAVTLADLARKCKIPDPEQEGTGTHCADRVPRHAKAAGTE